MEDAVGRPLRDVYSVSLGVALVLAVEQVVDLDAAGIPLETEAVLPFLAFVATAFSLYHWAIRFVDLPSERGERRSRAATATALVVGSTELLLLIALSTLVSRPGTFLGWLGALLAFEVAAGLALTATRAYGAAADFGRRYLFVNGVACLLAVVGALLLAAWGSEDALAGAVAWAVAWVRAAAFYRAGFDLLLGA